MSEVKIIEIKKSIFEGNNRKAAVLRDELKRRGCFLLNIMSSPGSGKTTAISAIAERLRGRYKIGVIEADIESDVDAAALNEQGVDAVQLHTGGMCHMDADMMKEGLDKLGRDYDLIILENIGNLVCPADFDLGAVINLVMLSVPEGHDKPLKYPGIFEISDALVISKIDVLPYFRFDMDKLRESVLANNGDIKIFSVSAVTGEGMDAFCGWLEEQIDRWKNS